MTSKPKAVVRRPRREAAAAVAVAAPATPPRAPIAIGARSAMVRAPRIPELMASDVRRRILSGELQEGDALAPEAELMAQYGISRPTLREALRILESDQLIVIRRGGIGGALVRRPDVNVAARQFALVLQDKAATMSDVHRARSVLEPPALAELARTIQPEQVKELRARLQATDSFIGDPDRYSLAIEQVREDMVWMTGATTLALIMRMLREVVQRHTASVGNVPPDKWAAMQRLSQRSHQKLLDIIATGDAAEAEAFWRKHLREVSRHLGAEAGARQIDLTL